MPVFGSRVVVGTANVKHIKEFNEDIAQREESLAQWEKEKQKRKEQLEVLHKEIEDRSRRNSIVSQKSREGEDETEDSVKFTDIPVTAEDTASAAVVVNEPFEAQEDDIEDEKKSSTCGKCSIQ